MLLRRWFAALAAVVATLAAVAAAAQPRTDATQPRADATQPRADATQPRADLFTVSPVPVDATAANASAARDLAIAEGEQQAFRMLMDRLTQPNDRARVPKVTLAQLNDLVQGFEVANERRSGVRYLADYTFHFRPEAVRQFLRRAGIAFAETPSKPLIVLPVLHALGRSLLWDDPNPWREAWANTKSASGLVPLVRPFGDLDDVQAIDADTAAQGDDAGLRAVAKRYGDGDVLVTQATLKIDGGQHIVDVTSTRYTPGVAGVEQTWVSSTTANPGESDADAMGRAVAATQAQVEEAWRLANTLDTNQSGTLLARVPAASLQEWVAVRDRLSGMAAVRSSRLLALDREGARIEIRFIGDAMQLRLALAQRDLELSGNDPDWVLQRRSGAAPPR
jgi:hypothetical protein